MPFSRGLSRPRDRTPVSCISRRFFFLLSHQRSWAIELLPVTGSYGQYSVDTVPSPPDGAVPVYSTLPLAVCERPRFPTLLLYQDSSEKENRLYMCIHANIYTYIGKYINIYTHTHKYIHTVDIYMYVIQLIYVYIYIYTYTHTYS